MRPLVKRSLMSAIFFVAVLLVARPGMAENYPNQPITLIVPFAVGGSTDLTARIFASALSREIGQQVVVDNKPGAGGTRGGRTVASAPPDGYTLLWSGSSLLSLAPLLYPKLSYDITTAYQPISRIMTHSLILAANTDLPVKNLTELIAYAKKNPGKLNYGSPGVGTIHHLTGELFKHEAGIDMAHIPYQGNGPAMTDLLAGNLQVMFMGIPQALGSKHNTKLRFLAVTSPEKDPSFPNVQTFTAAGLPNMTVAQSWYGVLGPRGMPAEVLSKLSAASRKAARSSEVVKAANDAGMATVVEEPDAFAAEIDRTTKAWSSLARATGLTFSE